jgi:hypothetical protein
MRRNLGMWDRSQDHLGLPTVECDHTFLRWQQCSQSKKLPLTRVLIRVRNRPLQERHRTGLSREQMSLWLAGYPKTPGFDVQFGSIATERRCPRYVRLALNFRHDVATSLTSIWSSRPEESHPRALPDPCVNLSIHTAPDARPFPWHSCQ